MSIFPTTYKNCLYRDLNLPNVFEMICSDFLYYITETFVQISSNRRIRSSNHVSLRIFNIVLIINKTNLLLSNYYAHTTFIKIVCNHPEILRVSCDTRGLYKTSTS